MLKYFEKELMTIAPAPKRRMVSAGRPNVMP